MINGQINFTSVNQGKAALLEVNDTWFCWKHCYGLQLQHWLCCLWVLSLCSRVLFLNAELQKKPTNGQHFERWVRRNKSRLAFKWFHIMCENFLQLSVPLGNIHLTLDMTAPGRQVSTLWRFHFSKPFNCFRLASYRAELWPWKRLPMQTD